MATDLLGRTMTPVEEELLELYRRTRALAARDLDPGASANVHAAAAALWNAVNDLALDYEQLVDLAAPPAVD